MRESSSPDRLNSIEPSESTQGTRRFQSPIHGWIDLQARVQKSALSRSKNEGAAGLRATNDLVVVMASRARGFANWPCVACPWRLGSHPPSKSLLHTSSRQLVVVRFPVLRSRRQFPACLVGTWIDSSRDIPPLDRRSVARCIHELVPLADDSGAGLGWAGRGGDQFLVVEDKVAGRAAVS